jgi:hypothetical protein
MSFNAAYPKSSHGDLVSVFGLRPPPSPCTFEWAVLPLLSRRLHHPTTSYYPALARFDTAYLNLSHSHSLFPRDPLPRLTFSNWAGVPPLLPHTPRPATSLCCPPLLLYTAYPKLSPLLCVRQNRALAASFLFSFLLSCLTNTYLHPVFAFFWSFTTVPLLPAPAHTLLHHLSIPCLTHCLPLTIFTFKPIYGHFLCTFAFYSTHICISIDKGVLQYAFI